MIAKKFNTIKSTYCNRRLTSIPVITIVSKNAIEIHAIATFDAAFNPVCFFARSVGPVTVEFPDSSIAKLKAGVKQGMQKTGGGSDNGFLFERARARLLFTRRYLLPARKK